MRIDYDSETCVGTGQLESLRSKLVGTQGVGRLSLVSQGRHKQLRWLKRLVGERGFEPPTPWSRNGHRNTILLIRFSLVLRIRPRFYPVFGSDWTQIGPKFSPRDPIRQTALSVMAIFQQLSQEERFFFAPPTCFRTRRASSRGLFRCV